jgi:nucleoside-diphosphate-sugar epimerase
MSPLTVAVTGVAGFLGQHLVPHLASQPDIGRIVGLDVREPPRRSAPLDLHRVDIAGHDLKPLLEGVDVLIHLASIVDPIADAALMTRVNVEGTKRVLDAAAAVGVRKIIRLSTTAAYGAWATNPLPLTEDAPLRPNPGFDAAVHAAEIERILAEWKLDHPAVTVTTLRAAPVLGAGAQHLLARLLTAPGRVRVRGATPPFQVVHVDDVVRAVSLVVREDHPGVLNVAADGWLAAEALDELVPRAVMPALPADVMRRALGRLWTSGVGDVPPTVVPYLVFPWVVASDRLQALGWEPVHSNEETVLETVDARPKSALPSGKTIGIVAGVTAIGILKGLALAWFLRRRRRRKRLRVAR